MRWMRKLLNKKNVFTKRLKKMAVDVDFRTFSGKVPGVRAGVQKRTSAV